MRSILAVVSLFASSAALAGATNSVSEPGSFELLALGGVVAAVVALRNRRK